MSLYLAVRTDKPEAELYVYSDTQLQDSLVWTAHRALLETIHLKIEELLKRNSITLHDLDGIVFYKGPGSFTGLRIGASVVNALGAGIDIPVVGKSGEQWLTEGVEALPSRPCNDYIQPYYGADAYTTAPKK